MATGLKASSRKSLVSTSVSMRVLSLHQPIAWRDSIGEDVESERAGTRGGLSREWRDESPPVWLANRANAACS